MIHEEPCQVGRRAEEELCAAREEEKQHLATPHGPKYKQLKPVLRNSVIY
jgi:hypothetical protein